MSWMMQLPWARASNGRAVYGNQLTGTIPPQLGSLTSLQYLCASHLRRAAWHPASQKRAGAWQLAAAAPPLALLVWGCAGCNARRPQGPVQQPTHRHGAFSAGQLAEPPVPARIPPARPLHP